MLYLAVILARRHRHALIDLRNHHAQVLLHLAQQVGLVVPDGTTALLSQTRVAAALAPRWAAVIPHLQTGVSGYKQETG